LYKECRNILNLGQQENARMDKDPPVKQETSDGKNTTNRRDALDAQQTIQNIIQRGLSQDEPIVLDDSGMNFVNV
jgi:hypothetical protein